MGQMLSIVQAVVMCYIVNLGTGKLLKVGGGVQIRRKGGIPALDSLLRNGDGMVLGQAQEGKKRVEGEMALWVKEILSLLEEPWNHVNGLCVCEP